MNKPREWTIQWFEEPPARGWKFVSWLPGTRADDGVFRHVVDKDETIAYVEYLEKELERERILSKDLRGVVNGLNAMTRKDKKRIDELVEALRLSRP